MHLNYSTYSYPALHKIFLAITFILFFGSTAFSQNNDTKENTSAVRLNPLLLGSFKQLKKVNPLLNEYIKPSRHELMYWPNYPLTAQQIHDRDKRNDRPIGEQIASDIIHSVVNDMLFGKKTPVAARPRF